MWCKYGGRCEHADDDQASRVLGDDAGDVQDGGIFSYCNILVKAY